MSIKIPISRSTENYSDNIARLQRELEQADAIIIGAGAGLSTSAGYTYSGERFQRYFHDFSQRYRIPDMYAGGFYPYKTLEEYWAWWSRQIYCNRYDQPENEVYQTLRKLVDGKDYFVLTTNVDHLFQSNGFDKKRLFYTQGDYGLWQCSKPCHQKTYDNEAAVREMVARQKDMKIPTELIPYCPICGAPMTMNLRADMNFVQDDGWYEACSRYEDFLIAHQGKHILYLELGVGGNTPVIIKYPFWKMTKENPNAVYVCINLTEAIAPKEIAGQSICIESDIGKCLRNASGAEAECFRRSACAPCLQM